MSTTIDQGAATLTPRLEEFVAGLRELADWIEQHPDAAASIHLMQTQFLMPAGVDVKKLRWLGAALDVPLDTTSGRYAQFVRTFGGYIDLMAYATIGSVCDFTVIGTKTENVCAWTLKDES